MGVMSKPKPPKPEPDEPSRHPLETLEVPRAWIREHGWPSCYQDLVDEPGITRSTQPRGAIAQRSYQTLDLAYFREGRSGEACLYAQAWVGPA